MKLRKALCGVGIALIVSAMVAADVTVSLFYTFIDEGLNGSGVVYSEESEKVLAKGDAFVSEIVKEGTTMLKNSSGHAPYAYDATTPSANRKTNIFGWSSVDAGFLISGYGSGVSRIPENKRVMLYGGFDAYNKVYSKKKIEYNENLKKYYEDWCSQRAVTDSLSGNDKLYTNYNPSASELESVTVDGGKTLLEDAKEYSDHAIVVLSRQSGEAQDCPNNYSYVVNTKGGSPSKVSRGYLSLTDEELGLLKLVGDNFEDVTVLLNCTNIVESGAFENSKIDNVYYIGVTGQSGAKAIPMVLTGDVNPSGRTTVTYPTDFSEDASFYNVGRTASDNSMTYVEDIYVGYKWWETANEMGRFSSYQATDPNKDNGKKGYDGIVQYPFGYGLSYTDFKWEIESESEKESALTPANGANITADSIISATVKVTNTGTEAGKDVVEMYFRPPYTNKGIEKSSIVLGDFAKTKKLSPGESDYVTLTLEPFQMASYDCYDKNENGFRGYELESGNYEISLRTDVHNVSSVEPITYSVSGGIQFDKDPTTGEAISNHFTGNTASGRLPIDGCSFDGTTATPFTFLTRSDFANSFQKTAAVKKVDEAANTYDETYDTAANFGVDSGQYLYTGPNGEKLSAAVLKSPTNDTVKANVQLMKTLGKNYDDPAWEGLLDELSADDAIKLIVMGGYSTAEAESIGKIWLRDNDGPMGLTRSNASINETSKWTWFPMSGLLGYSWNKELAKEYGSRIAEEGVATGVHGWYAPGANLIRSPFGGRANEYYSEDPTLSGEIGGNTVLGALEGNMTPYMKHFALNETETNRGSLFTWLTEQNLRENYLRPFEIAIKKYQCNALMSAFNKIGGRWAGASHGLLTDVLRREWGFRGSVVTDWVTGANNASVGLAAGNDLWLNGGQLFSHNLGSDWASDAYKANRVRFAAHNILYSLCETEAIYQKKLAEAGQSGSQTIVDVVRPTPYWLMAVVGINLLLFSGASVLLYFGFVKKKGKSDSQEDAK